MIKKDFMFTISTFKYGLFDIKHCVSLIYVFVLTTTCSQSVSSRMKVGNIITIIVNY